VKVGGPFHCFHGGTCSNCRRGTLSRWRIPRDGKGADRRVFEFPKKKRDKKTEQYTLVYVKEIGVNENEILDAFGRILISEVRDEGIRKHEKIVLGQMKSAQALELHEKLRSFDDEELSRIRQLVVETIDNALHNFLCMIEGNEEMLEVNCGEHEESTKENIRELSDGLAGELYTEDGWIARFSTFKENYRVFSERIHLTDTPLS